MDDLAFGKRNKKGDWAPNAALEVAPFWYWPPNLVKIGKWLVAYVWPHNAIFMAITIAYWNLALPSWEIMKTFSWGWALKLHVINSLGIFLFFGAIELFYYVRRRQGTRFKYNGKFPTEQPSDVFWFKSQNLDNFLRTFLISIPLWSLIEVFTFWAFANGYGPWLNPDTHWFWLGVLIFLVPAIHEVHFFCGHWLIHQGVLYKYIHSVHHNSVNPSPWSSMSMHPVEGAFFFSEMMWHLLIPSHPFVALFQLTSTAYGAVVGHIGFEKLELSEETAMNSHAYTHYLHHKYFEVNYGGDGVIPLDKWFGTWHDGTKEAQDRMEARYARRVASANAQQNS